MCVYVCVYLCGTVCVNKCILRVSDTSLSVEPGDYIQDAVSGDVRLGMSE